MKKILLAVLMSYIFLNPLALEAQNWVNGGNALGANGTLGTTTNFSVLFKTNNVERGRITNTGLWGIGTTSPNSTVHINSASGQNPFRIQVNAVTKLLVHSNGGVAIGQSTTPPANGLFVLGNTGIGTATPENTLHVFKGAAGAKLTGFVDAPLIVENSTRSYINILAPDTTETGVAFGKPANNISGAIVYNNKDNLNGLQFRTNGNITGMVLTDQGNLGVGGSPRGFKAKIRHGSFGFDIERAGTGDDWEFFVDSLGNLQLHFNAALKGTFNKTSGAYTSTSDERLKTNIKAMGNMIEKIKQLKPSTYQYKNSADSQVYNGFIAQDVMKIFPGMVIHNVNPERKLDIYTLDYSQFGVLAIKGIQELLPLVEEQKSTIEIQKKQIEEQTLDIEALEHRLTRLEENVTSINVNKSGSLFGEVNNALLAQNQPNPFNANTTIRYNIPQGSRGTITIYDKSGKLVKLFNADRSGQLQFSAYNLPAGTYTYSLVIDGRVASSKQMLIAK